MRHGIHDVLRVGGGEVDAAEPARRCAVHGFERIEIPLLAAALGVGGGSVGVIPFSPDSGDLPANAGGDGCCIGVFKTWVPTSW